MDNNGYKEIARQVRKNKIQYQRFMLELAEKTDQWFHDNSCYRNDDNDVLGYATITTGKTKHKPVWCDTFDLSPKDWVDVHAQMLASSIPIAYKPFHGWYVGHAGEQGVQIGKRFNYLLTSMQTIIRNLQYVVMAGDYPDIKPYLEEALNPAWQDADISKLAIGLQDVLVGAGVDVQTSMAQFLLMSTADEPNGHKETV